MTPELLAPAGGFEAALAAFQYGADAVYLGLPRFSARADADNLTPDRLRALLAYARSFAPAKKIYVTLNTLVRDAELADVLRALDQLDDLAPDGLIVQDLGVARLARDHAPRLALHASTQMAAHNLDGVLALKALGFTRVVLARELALGEAARIVRESGVEIELFVHGALCYSVSGLCLFSSLATGRSGNRGRCAYCCRETFAPPEADSRDPAARHPFSMRDLALAPLLDRVAATGAHALKIEGRMKSPLYVAAVTDLYRRTLDRRLDPEEARRLAEDLQTVFSRPWTALYAESADAPPETVIDPLAVGHRGAPIGRVEAVVRDRAGRRWLRFDSDRALERHDGLQVEAPGGGQPFGFAVDLLRPRGASATVIALPAGAAVEVALPEGDATEPPRGAAVFCSASQEVRRRYAVRAPRESALPTGRPARFHVTLAPDGVAVRAVTSHGPDAPVEADARLAAALAPSRQPGQTAAAVRKAFERLGDSPWRLADLALDDPAGLYAPPSLLNEARRAAAAALAAAWEERRARRLREAAESWGLGAAAAPRAAAEPRWSVKFRAGQTPPPAEALAGCETLVLALGHDDAGTARRLLARWRGAFPGLRVLIALPLLSREARRGALRAAAEALARDGWADWEAADLAGCRLLGGLGLAPVSADWSLYALNRAAAAELARLGVRRYTLSPELPLADIRALAALDRTSPYPAPEPETLAFQHTPLFLSETAPCLAPGAAPPPRLADRRGRRFLTAPVDGHWVTVAERPFCLADRLAETGCARFRVDLSWSPESTDAAAVVRDVLAGRRPADAHAGNLDRGLS